MVHRAMEAAGLLAKEGIQCEVIDPRTTSPMDLETIIESVENTGRLVVVDESNPRCSMAADISAQVTEQAFGSLKGPVKMVTAPHCPPPFSDVLEDLYMPSAEKIAEAARALKQIFDSPLKWYSQRVLLQGWVYTQKSLRNIFSQFVFCLATASEKY